ncbi:MAG: hypothetical protein AAGB29_14335 [Planctomycetota bacterium]
MYLLLALLCYLGIVAISLGLLVFGTPRGAGRRDRLRQDEARDAIRFHLATHQQTSHVL